MLRVHIPGHGGDENRGGKAADGALAGKDAIGDGVQAGASERKADSRKKKQVSKGR